LGENRPVWGFSSHYRYPVQGFRTIWPSPLLTSFYNEARLDECAHARLYFGGHAGFFALAMDACEALRQGHIEAALVGGADSYLFRPLLASLDEAYRLKSDRNLDGFRPAEGAGFVVLEPALRPGAAPLALVDGLATSMRPTGEQGLTEVLRSFSLPGERPSRIISDLNGETTRAREWAIVATRLGQTLGDAASVEHPAISTVISGLRRALCFWHVPRAPSPAANRSASRSGSAQPRTIPARRSQPA
jgi:hypothetical protein